MLAVTGSARAYAVIPRDEDTLSRGLRTSPLPGTHASVADYWQNNRWCHPLPKEHHSFSDTLVSHPNDRSQQPAHAGAALTFRENVPRVAGLLQRLGRPEYLRCPLFRPQAVRFACNLLALSMASNSSNSELCQA